MPTQPPFSQLLDGMWGYFFVNCVWCGQFWNFSGITTQFQQLRSLAFSLPLGNYGESPGLVHAVVMERGRGGDGGEVSPVLFSAVPTPSKHSVGVACSSHRAKGLSSAKGDGGGGGSYLWGTSTPPTVS